MNQWQWNKTTDELYQIPFAEYLDSLQGKTEEDIEAARRIGTDYVKLPWRKTLVHVSTVFLRIDHNFGYSKEPVLFETMIFGGPWDEWQERYCTAQEARDGHAKALRIARQARWRIDWWLPVWWNALLERMKQ